MRAEAVVDRLLTHAAEALIRKPSRRPNWLPKSFPMKLILTMKRELLINVIRNDPSFRHYLYHQANKRGLGLDPHLLDGVTAENFERTLNQSPDPHRLVPTAFVGPDDELCEVAAPWVQYQELIPAPQVAAAVEPVTEPAPPSSIEAAYEDVVAAGRDGSVTDEVDEDTPRPDEPGVSEPVEEIVAPAPPPTVPVAPAQPRPDLPEQQSGIVPALEAEVASLRRRNAKLEAENKDLLSRVPTKLDRRRIKKQSGALKRTQEELERARDQLVELGDERDHLIQMRATAEEQLDEAIDARAVAEQKSRTLEAQLATTEGRARYFRKAIDNDLAEARALAEGLEHGRDLTKATRRIEALTALADSLDAAFPPEPASALPRPRRVGTGQSLDLAVTPLGGGEEIGGSAILVEGGGRRILVDAGLHPDGRGPVDVGRLFEDGRPLDAIIVTGDRPVTHGPLACGAAPRYGRSSPTRATSVTRSSAANVARTSCSTRPTPPPGPPAASGGSRPASGSPATSPPGPPSSTPISGTGSTPGSPTPADRSAASREPSPASTCSPGCAARRAGGRCTEPP